MSNNSGVFTVGGSLAGESSSNYSYGLLSGRSHGLENSNSKVKYFVGKRSTTGGSGELEEVKVQDLGEVTYGTTGSSTPNYSQTNGPRLVPGIITSRGPATTRGSESYFKTSTTINPNESESPKSNNKINLGVKGPSRPIYLSTDGSHEPKSLSSSNFHLPSSCEERNDENLASQDLELIIDENLKMKTKSAANIRKLDEKRKDLFLLKYNSSNTNSKSHPEKVKREGLLKRCRWTFVFDPAGRLCYYWSLVVSLAFLYNFWVINYRFAFQEISSETLGLWFSLDYLADFLYVLDIGVHFRTGYLEDGVLQTDSTKLRHHYMNSTTFYIDCLCLLPLDFLYLSIRFNSILRCFRLVKIYRFWAFMDRTERHTNYPNLFRSLSLVHYLFVIFHWNACLFHIIRKNKGFGSDDWVFKNVENEESETLMLYLQSFYWSTLALTTVGDLPRPRTKGEFIYVIFQLLLALLLFATILGHVANIVTNVSAARKEFQGKLDGVKTYMRMRRVPNYLQVKVIKWFDYLWLTQKCSDEDKAVGCLPDKLKAEIAINVHLDTLRRVEIFQNTEAGFLCELVLRLRPVLFSPGDYICRKGEVGKEMYIVNRGRLQVVADDGKTVLATLKPGSYFGEISILNMGTAGNRRTASVRSVGYSDLFVLSKTDMWDVLKEYPAARVRLEAIAVKRLEKYKKTPMEKVGLGRCNSSPGLVESNGKVPLEEMWISESSETDGKKRDESPRPESYNFHPDRGSDRSKNAPDDKSLHLLDENINLNTNLNPNLPNLNHNSDGEKGSELVEEIRRLRMRLLTLESENASLSLKLSQQQWDVEHRLAEIEMHICGASSVPSSGDEERNRESAI